MLKSFNQVDIEAPSGGIGLATTTLASALDDILRALTDSTVAVFANVGFEKIGRLAVNGNLQNACAAAPAIAARLSSALDHLKPGLSVALPHIEEKEIELLIDVVKPLLQAGDVVFSQERVLCLGLLKARLTEVVIREQIRDRNDPFQIFSAVTQAIDVRH